LTKNIIILFFLLFSLTHVGQSVINGQKEINLFSCKDSINYSEGTIKIRDTLFTEIIYQYSDTSYAHVHLLDIAILNPVIAKKKRVLNLTSDTLIVKAKYRFDICPAIDDRDISNGKVFGRIEIIDLGRKKATVKFDLYTFDVTGLEKRKFIGTRTFRKNVRRQKFN